MSFVGLEKRGGSGSLARTVAKCSPGAPDKLSQLIKLHRKNRDGILIPHTLLSAWGTCLPGFHFSKAEIDTEISHLIKGEGCSLQVFSKPFWF